MIHAAKPGIPSQSRNKKQRKFRKNVFLPCLTGNSNIISIRAYINIYSRSRPPRFAVYLGHQAEHQQSSLHECWLHSQQPVCVPFIRSRSSANGDGYPPAGNAQTCSSTPSDQNPRCLPGWSDRIRPENKKEDSKTLQQHPPGKCPEEHPESRAAGYSSGPGASREEMPEPCTGGK